MRCMRLSINLLFSSKKLLMNVVQCFEWWEVTVIILFIVACIGFAIIVIWDGKEKN